MKNIEMVWPHRALVNQEREREKGEESSLHMVKMNKRS